MHAGVSLTGSFRGGTIPGGRNMTNAIALRKARDGDAPAADALFRRSIYDYLFRVGLVDAAAAKNPPVESSWKRQGAAQPARCGRCRADCRPDGGPGPGGRPGADRQCHAGRTGRAGIRPHGAGGRPHRARPPAPGSWRAARSLLPDDPVQRRRGAVRRPRSYLAVVHPLSAVLTPPGRAWSKGG